MVEWAMSLGIRAQSLGLLLKSWSARGGRRGTGWETQTLWEGISGASSGMRLADGYHKEGGPSAPWDAATDRKWRRLQLEDVKWLRG